ncbi:hypothetical protein [Modestobacter sp. VKM Ac-2978]|uniref:hypothetical protein n=1 Tax=Modestobacter sp. VKM Ac-2978 TaxID=3004132 RepID=UPI0022AAEB9E|nr:hypothetical protein [Modestobacter sp. VKM Ac-2978]MCZ2849481.1 hypothetical protein [Modestobacter sp. VKM Ac-2978]
MSDCRGSGSAGSVSWCVRGATGLSQLREAPFGPLPQAAARRLTPRSRLTSCRTGAVSREGGAASRVGVVSRSTEKSVANSIAASSSWSTAGSADGAGARSATGAAAGTDTGLGTDRSDPSVSR